MLLENVRLALIALKANKLRTFLTMLGIIIGLASMVMIMTIGNAMNNMVNSQMGDMGANNLYLYVTAKTVDELKRLSLPAGVDISIKIGN